MGHYSTKGGLQSQNLTSKGGGFSPTHNPILTKEERIRYMSNPAKFCRPKGGAAAVQQKGIKKNDSQTSLAPSQSH